MNLVLHAFLESLHHYQYFNQGNNDARAITRILFYLGTSEKAISMI